jgi:prepilin-type N-terminal cleavage/methylation domain-containing protein
MIKIGKTRQKLKHLGGQAGFTLIELIIAVAVLAITSALTLLTMNNYNNNQAQRSVRSEIVANLRMARSLAKTMQKPDGLTGNLRYVEVTIYGNTVVEAKAVNSIGASGIYFSRNVGKKGVSVSEPSEPIIFAPYEGKLMKFVGTDLVPLDDTESREILVGTGDFSETSVIEIGPQGVVDDTLTKSAHEGEFLAGTLLLTSVPPSATPTLVSPSPTLAYVPPPTPTTVIYAPCSSCPGLVSNPSLACSAAGCLPGCYVMQTNCINNPYCYRGLCMY